MSDMLDDCGLGIMRMPGYITSIVFMEYTVLRVLDSYILVLYTWYEYRTRNWYTTHARRYNYQSWYVVEL